MSLLWKTAMEDRQREFLQAKNEAHRQSQPGWDDLRSHLLSLGGEEVVSPGHESDLDALLSRGRESDGADSLLWPDKPVNCHGNAGRLSQDGHHLETGYAMKRDDGLWRQHSWGVHRDQNQIIETTVPRDKYFGFRLDEDEAEKFRRANP